MLLGEYDHVVDEKNRMFLPAKMREECGGCVYLVKSVDRCVSVYPEGSWQRFTEKLDALPQVKAREVRRFLLSSAEKTTVDSHGRVLIPQALKEYAGLGKNVKVLGVGEYAEIWSVDELNGHRESVDNQEMISELIELGF